MVQAHTPDRIKELIDLSIPEGAEAFGMQFCRLDSEYRNRAVYEELFDYADDKPVYVTNYRSGGNKEKNDDQLAEELLELADCGATLCDVMGDLFDQQADEMARDAEVLMSSHVLKFTPAERVLEIALEQERRGADICKIVTRADNMSEQIENIKMIDMLRQNLKIPFLYLAGGECHLMRRIGGEIGCCMYLCVHEYDELATKSQPLLRDMKTIREIFNK